MTEYRKHNFVLIKDEFGEEYVVCKSCCREIWKNMPECPHHPATRTGEIPTGDGLAADLIIDENPRLPYADEETE